MNTQPIEKASNNAIQTGYENSKFAVLILADDGMIQSCNIKGMKLLDYRPGNLAKQHISEVLPQLSDINLLKGERVNPYLRFLSRIGHPFAVVGKNDQQFSGELFFQRSRKSGPASNSSFD
jgi:sensor histidine kinase regulating citrate/malate metabolism